MKHKKKHQAKRWHIGRDIALVLTFLLTAAGCWLHFYGLPEPANKKIEQLLKEHGIHAEYGNISWLPPNRIVVEKLDIYDSQRLGGLPRVQIDRATVSLDPLGHSNGRELLSDVQIEGATYRFTIKAGPMLEDNPDILVGTGIHGNLSIDEHAIHVHQLDGKLKDTKLHASGTIRRRAPDKNISYGQRMRNTFNLKRRPPPAWRLELIRDLHHANLNGHLDVAFQFDPDLLDKNAVEISASGTNCTYKSEPFDSWHFDMGLHGRHLEIRDLYMQRSGKKISLKLQRDYLTTITEMQAHSALPFEPLSVMLPAKLTDTLENARIELLSTPDIEIKLGPAPALEMRKTGLLNLKIPYGSFRDVAFHQMDSRVSWQGKELTIDWIKAHTDPEKTQPLELSGHWSPMGKQLTLNARYKGLPEVFYPLCPPKLTAIFERFTFRETPAEIDVKAIVQTDQIRDLQIVGDAKLNDVLYRNVPVKNMITHLDVAAGQVNLQPFTALRKEGQLGGRLLIDWRKRFVDFDLSGSGNAKELAPAIHKSVVKILDKMTIPGTTTFKGTGHIDLKDFDQSVIDARIQGESLQVNSLQATNVSFQLEGRGRVFVLRDFAANMYNGDLQASIEIFPVTDDHKYRCSVVGNVTNVNFQELADQMRPEKENSKLQGQISGHAALSCIIDPNWTKSLVASGKLHLTEGTLLSTPLFGPISRLLSKVSPNLGCLTQNELQMPFELAHEKIKIEKGRLYGNVISVFFSGHANFKSELDFNVQIRFMRDNFVSEVLNFITYPITKVFLYFQLGGTISEPDWRPKNLPKELYLDFD